MNRNVLKIIAILSMLIDHIGSVFFPDIIIFRIIGRIAMPIFAYFIAIGYEYTSNLKKYIFRIVITFLVSWIPFLLLFGYSYLKINILGIFVLSLILLKLIDNYRKSANFKGVWFLLVVLITIFYIGFYLMGFITYGVFVLYLPVVFSLIRKNRKLQILLTFILLVGESLITILFNPTLFSSYVQLFSILSLVFIILYNNKKGLFNLKYLFYIFYPAHLVILLIIKNLLL